MVTTHRIIHTWYSPGTHISYLYYTNNCCYCLVVYDAKKQKLETLNAHGGHATTLQDSRAIVRPWKAGFFKRFLRVLLVFVA